ncbi:9339_t:CDS:2, partial [Rhizophagus irregularis]
SSEEVAEAFKSIYDNPDKPFNWPRKIQCDKGTEFMGYVTLLMDEHGVEIQRIIACFRHISFAMIDHYAGLFEYRVFKNQYLIEFLLPTGKHCRECERFARKIVDNMNDSPTRLIEMSPNDITKLEQIYSKLSVKYNRPIGVDEPQLPKGTTIRFLLAPEEWKNDPFEQRRITNPIWSPSMHKIQRIVVGRNPPMLVLYYLDDLGPQRPFVREQLMHIKEEHMLPFRWVLGDNQMP